jgi:hypothetical protein
VRGAGNGISDGTHKFLSAALGHYTAHSGNIEVVFDHAHAPLMLATVRTTGSRRGSSQLMSIHNFIAIRWHGECQVADIVPLDGDKQPTPIAVHPTTVPTVPTGTA